MKLGQLIEYNMRNIFFKICADEAGRLVSDLFFFFKIAYYEVKVSLLELSFNIFR